MDQGVSRLATEQALLCDLVGQVVLFATVVVSATTDIVHRKVYNGLTYPVIAFGFVLGFAANGVDGFLDHLGGFAIASAIFGVAALSDGVKYGDWKLAAAIGAIAGWRFTIPCLFYGTLVGAAMSIGLMAYYGRVFLLLKRSARLALGLGNPEAPENDPIRQRVPYAVALALGTFLAWIVKAYDEGVLT